MENSDIRLEISTIWPQGEGEIDFEAIDCLPLGDETNITEDDELNYAQEKAVIEMIGPDSKITFYTNCERHLLVLHLKSCGRFLDFSFILRDDTGKEKFFEVSNKRTLVLVDQEKSLAQLPLIIKDRGWQRICLDMDLLLSRSFGTNFESCVEVTVSGTCRLYKLYFQSYDYADAQLPEFLRVAADN